jgi:hypothetical protein
MADERKTTLSDDEILTTEPGVRSSRVSMGGDTDTDDADVDTDDTDADADTDDPS